MRLIDADKLSEWIAEQFCEDMPKHWDSTAESILRHLNKMPTVDAVEAVRCKNCENWIQHDRWSHCYLDGRETTENDFCSWAERIEDETD